MDPIALRKKNALKPGHTTAMGEVVTESSCCKVLDQLKMSMDEYFSGLSATSPRKALGTGLAGCFWGLPGPGGSSATIKLNEDGTVVLSMGSAETGAGSHTAMAALVSEELSIPMDRIRVIGGDTDNCPYDAGAVGSRTTWAMGDAVHQAVTRVKERLLKFAESQLNVPSDKLVFIAGRIEVKDNPEVFIPIPRTVRRMMGFGGGPVIATSGPSIPRPRTYAFGAQAVVVEVDRDTGKVDVLKVVAIHDVGKALFKAGVEGQIQGGVAAGLGFALSEEVIFSEGRPVNPSFLDYRLPTFVDVPEIIAVVLEKENPKIPDDIRGIGEPPIAPTAAAIANAVHNAVGVRVNQVPLTPERVYKALKAKNRLKSG